MRRDISSPPPYGLKVMQDSKRRVRHGVQRFALKSDAVALVRKKDKAWPTDWLLDEEHALAAANHIS